MSDDEYARVRARATSLGISVPRALIEAAIGVPPLTRREREALHQELTGLKWLLGNLANNTNQIARQFNSDQDVPAAQLRAVLERSARAIERVEALAEEYRA